MADVGFWRSAAADPDRLALVDPDGTEHTAGEMLANANRLVHGLRALGLRRGDAVSTMLPNGVAAIEMYLAALQAGWYLTPINYHLSGPEIAYILNDAGANAFVTSTRYAEQATDAIAEMELSEASRFVIPDGAPDGAPDVVPDAGGGGESGESGENSGDSEVAGYRSVAELIDGQSDTMPDDRVAGMAMHYTSGTTGRPKGVRRGLPDLDPDTNVELHSMLLSLFGIEPDDGNVHLVTSPNYHTAVTMFGGSSLHYGHTLVMMDKWTPEGTLERIERYGVTTTHMVPTQFHRMLALPDDVREGFDVSSMRYAIHAAAPCPVDVKRKMLDWWGPVIYEYYAATEGGGTLATPQEWLEHPGTVGKPWPISEVICLDDDMREVPRGTPGTVYMKTMGAEFEYKDDREKTDESRYDDFFTVGDIGYMTDDDFLFLCDRKSDMIISGGVNIYPAEIEGEILSHPDVADVAVFGIPDPDWGEQIKAVVEPKADVEAGDDLAESILDHVRGRLGKFKWPKSIDFIETMPRDPSGKLYKRKLRDPYWEDHEAQI